MEGPCVESVGRGAADVGAAVTPLETVATAVGGATVIGLSTVGGAVGSIAIVMDEQANVPIPTRQIANNFVFMRVIP
jgi:hypothetical protein